MKIMDLQVAKKELLSRKNELQELIKSVENDSSLESDSWKVVNEIGDESFENQELLTRQEKLDNLNLLLRRVNQSLEDLEKERYGICNKCEKHISEDRLKVYPLAQYCLTCQKSIDIENR